MRVLRERLRLVSLSVMCAMLSRPFRLVSIHHVSLWPRKHATRMMSLCILAVASSAARAAAPPITALAFAPDGKTVVVGSQAGLEVRTWPELNSARMLPSELVHIHDVAFAPNGTILAAAGGTPGKRGVVELYQWPEGKLHKRLSPHRDLFYGVAWRGDSALFATASADRSAGLHEAATGKTVHVLEGHSRGVLAAVFLPANAGLITAGIDESLRLWDVKDGTLLRTFPNHTRPVIDLKVKPVAVKGGGADKNAEQAAAPLVVSASEDRTVRLWQPTLGRLMRFVRLESPPRAVAWTQDAQALVAACKDGKVRVIDPDTVEVIEEQSAVEGVAHSVAVAPDGSVLVGGQNGKLRRVTLTASKQSAANAANAKVELPGTR